MNIVVWGNSHLTTFREALFSLVTEQQVRASFLPTPNVVNRSDIINHLSGTARLAFSNGSTSFVELPPSSDSFLVIVGNGNYGHFSTFQRPGCFPPLWVYSSQLGLERNRDQSVIARMAPISSSLFKMIYRDKPLQHLLYRSGFSKVYFEQFLKVFIFVSPTPARSFFLRQNHSQNYLESGCLNYFKHAYGLLFEEQIDDLGLRGLAINYPSSMLESLDGTTLEEYLMDEELQVHANPDYWQQRIKGSSLFG
jgi:hypothetical protein